ncbi:MAG: hypothetical protein OHK0031_15000 [Anaerolineales bacterium]
MFFLLAFFSGAIPFSVWLPRLAGRDPRLVGDKNPGATNAFKAGGKFIGLAALLLDISKAAAPVGLAYQIFGWRGAPMLWIALAPSLGHAWSPFLRFRGGKALATVLGAWIGLTLWDVPLVALAGISLWFVLLKNSAWAVLLTLLGVEGAHSQLAHHNIFFSADYRREFQQIFSQKILPDDPTIYLCITSKSEAGHAPPGCENWFVMINSPTLNDKNEPDAAQNAAAAEKILARLAGFGLDVRDKIRFQRLITPRDIQQNSGAFRGSLYGLSFNERMAPFKRPHNRSEFGGLYFAGGSTHPGGGVPLVTLSGKLAAALLEMDERMKK